MSHVLESLARRSWRLSLLGSAVLLATAVACSDERTTHGGPAGDGSSAQGDAGDGQGDGAGNGEHDGQGSGSDGDDSPDGGDSCANADVKAARDHPTIWLLVDQCLAPQSSQVQEDWAHAHEALLGPEGVATQLQEVVRFGLLFTGETEEEYNGASCGAGVEVIEPAFNNVAAISELYTAEHRFDGNCMPYYGFEALKGYPRVSSEAVVFLTRAGPNWVCYAEFLDEIWAVDGGNQHFTSARQTKSAVQELAEEGVTSYVVGGLFPYDDGSIQVPDYQEFSMELAVAGNSGTPYTVNNFDQLKEALVNITGQLVSCEVKLNGEVKAGAECEGYVEVDGAKLPCNDPDGWRLKDAETVEITGQACTALKEKPQAEIKADFPCDVITIF